DHPRRARPAILLRRIGNRRILEERRRDLPVPAIVKRPVVFRLSLKISSTRSANRKLRRIFELADDDVAQRDEREKDEDTPDDRIRSDPRPQRVEKRARF